MKAAKRYGIPTGIKLEPYTEPNQKAIDLQHAHDIENVARMNYSKGAEDAWEFAKRIICPSDCCDDSISRHTKEIFGKEGWETRGIFVEMTYQEAKREYEKWKKSKDEIHVGDEVTDNDLDDIGVVTYVDDSCYCILWSSGVVSEDVRKSKLRSTGRHFNIIHETLKKMKEGDRT